MARCRVFHLPDRSVRIVHPAAGAQLDGEEDDAFYERVMREAMESNPELASLTFEDMDATHLPLREAPCAQCGGSHPARDKWRGEPGKGVWVQDGEESPQETLAHLQGALDAELAKPEPNPVTVIRLYRAVQKGGK